MAFDVFTLLVFEKQTKRLLKKYPSLAQDLAALIQSLAYNPLQGSKLAHNCYKIRLSIASKGKGKRGGARVISFVWVSEQAVYLLSLYDKSEKETLSNKELLDLLSEVEQIKP